MSGVGEALPSPSPIIPSERVASLYLLHLRFTCGVADYGDLDPIWEDITRSKGQIEGLADLKQALFQGLPYCLWVFRGRYHFIASLPLIDFIKKVSVLNPPLDPPFPGGGSPNR